MKNTLKQTLCGFLLIFVTSLYGLPMGTYHGKVLRVVDGDTLEVSTRVDKKKEVVRLRLFGVDTPELNAKNKRSRNEAKRAKVFSKALSVLSGHRVTFEVVGPASYRDASAVVYLQKRFKPYDSDGFFKENSLNHLLVVECKCAKVVIDGRYAYHNKRRKSVVEQFYLDLGVSQRMVNKAYAKKKIYHRKVS